MADRATESDANMPPADDADELTRLRQELAAARAEQAATASILRATASGPKDPQAFLQAIVDEAMRLCDANRIAISLIRGDEIERVANIRRDGGIVAVATGGHWNLAR
jgi:hypothetical protein